MMYVPKGFAHGLITLGQMRTILARNPGHQGPLAILRQIG
jgi:hypothetical protein